MSSPSAPPAGWYPDPTGSGRQRFFDGDGWTDQTRDAPARLARRATLSAPPAAAPVAAPAASAPGDSATPTPATPAAPVAPPAAPGLQRQAAAAAPLTAPAAAPVASPSAVRRPFSSPALLARRGAAVSPLSSQALLVGAGGAPRPARPEPAHVPPGWYPDPARGGGLRFFDGVKWTARTRPLPRARDRRMPVPAAVVAYRVLSAQDAAAVRRAHDPLPVERIRVPRAQSAPSLTHSRARTGSLVGTLATLTMLLGVAAAGYFSWTLWGSDYYTAWKQNQLKADLHASAPASTAPAAPAAPAAKPPIPPMPADHSGPVAEIKIPKIGLDMAVVAGTDETDLKQGPGLWLPGSFPGTPGNTTISGHRTTYAHPFRHLDELVPGDRIYIDVPGQPEAVYEVRGSTIASPFAVQVTRQAPGVRLTLTTCNPVGSASQRLVVEAEEVSGAWADQAVDAAHWQLLQ